jgi:2-oxoglutarate ferredoxin oxidoreductase subunit alpha
VRLLRREGFRVSHLRLVTVFPFPAKAVREFCEGLERVVVPELNLGQIGHVVREAAAGLSQVEGVWRIGGEILRPQDIAQAVRDGGEPL